MEVRPSVVRAPLALHDALPISAGKKGQAQTGGKKALGRRARGRRKKREPGRGHYDKDWPAILAWVSRQGGVVIQATRDRKSTRLNSSHLGRSYAACCLKRTMRP